MAWIDDRIWCHPKLTDISDKAFRVWVNGVAYSTGFGTRGVLSVGQQKRIGSNARIRSALIAAELWDELPDDAVSVHDWDVHNSKRDARRAADRERKKRERAGQKDGQSTGTSTGASAGQSTGRSDGTSTVSARAEGSEGSEGSERPRAVTESRPAALAVVETNGPGNEEIGETIEQSLKETA